MKTNIIKKLVATLCAITMSISIISPIKAIKFNETLINFNIPELENPSATIPSCLRELEIIRKDVSTSFEDNQSLSKKKIINLLIDDLSDKLNKIYELEIQDFSSIKNALIELNYLNISLNSLSTLPKNTNQINTISDGLFEARSKLYQIYENLNKYNINTNKTTIAPIANNNFSQTNIGDDYNSENEEWWDTAEIEIDRLINDAELTMKRKNTNISNLYEKSKKFYAGFQSKNNCWLFTSQNIANYFLYLNNQNPIAKFNKGQWDGPRDIVEQEFIKRQPDLEYMLRRAGSQYDMISYLKTYGISANEVSVFNKNINNEKHKKIMKKIAYFLLIRHFSNNDTPVATNVGYHWVAVAGIDINSKQAVILDPMKENPIIGTLDYISNRISTMINKGVNHILILFPHQGYSNYVTCSSYSGMNWNRFKSEMLTMTNQQL